MHTQAVSYQTGMLLGGCQLSVIVPFTPSLIQIGLLPLP